MHQEPTEVIFELGLNHLGDVARACRMVDLVKEGGGERLTLQVVRDPGGMSRDPVAIKTLRGYCLPFSECLRVVDYARGQGLRVGAAIVDPAEVQPLVDHGVEFFKIISGDLTFDALIISACSTGLPVYLSTGASTIDEVGRAIAIGRSAHPQADIRLIHTVLVVPTPDDLLNLRNIQTLSGAFDLPVAYGQHSDNHEALPVAVAAGATALFVYVAEARDPELPDGPNALECAEVGKLLERVRSIDAMLGSAKRRVSDREATTRSAARRSLVARRRIRNGETITESDLGSKRPWTGIAPWDRSTLVGREVTRDFEIDEDVVPDVLAGSQEDQR